MHQSAHLAGTPLWFSSMGSFVLSLLLMSSLCFPRRNSYLLSKLFLCISYRHHPGEILGFSHPPCRMRPPCLATAISARLLPSFLDRTLPRWHPDPGCGGSGSRRRKLLGLESVGTSVKCSVRSGHLAKDNKVTQNDTASEDMRAPWEARALSAQSCIHTYISTLAKYLRR